MFSPRILPGCGRIGHSLSNAVSVAGMLLLCLLLVQRSAAQEAIQQIAELGQCPLANGQVIEDCRVGYRTYGHLNADHGNVVVMPTWLNGRSEDLKLLFGALPTPVRLVDTSVFYGIAFDAFGDGVSSSPSNSPKQAGPAFPRFNMEDMVRAQYRVLTEVLGIRHLHAAIGLSMGGHQVFAYTVLYPGFVDLAVPIVGSPQTTAYDLLSKQTVMDAIEADPEFHGGHYTTQPGLKLANELGSMMVTTPASRNAETSRDGFAAWLATVEATQRQDANDRMSQLRAIVTQDVLHGRTMEAAARAMTAKMLVIESAEDRMVVPQPALAWAAASGSATYVSHGTCAHLIMACDAAAVTGRVLPFLAQEGKLRTATNAANGTAR